MGWRCTRPKISSVDITEASGGERKPTVLALASYLEVFQGLADDIKGTAELGKAHQRQSELEFRQPLTSLRYSARDFPSS